MMNLRFEFGHVLVLCLVLSLPLGESIWGAEPDTHIDRLASAYLAARTDSARRAVCLEAIDAGVIARGRSVAVVDAVFGTTYAKKLPAGANLRRASWTSIIPRPPRATKSLPPTSAGILHSGSTPQASCRTTT
jgi:hypothetical protein